jgi:hypothetical protein
MASRMGAERTKVSSPEGQSLCQKQNFSALIGEVYDATLDAAV